MKKLISVFLCISMLLACMSIQAMATTTDVTAEDGLVQVVESMDVNEYDVANVTPRNKDYIQLSRANNYQGTFYVRKGENVKVHMYIDSYIGLEIPIRINFNSGTWPTTVVGTWRGTGHKYADLCLNCQAPGKYSIWLEGSFEGSGAVYREP